MVIKSPWISPRAIIILIKWQRHRIEEIFWEYKVRFIRDAVAFLGAHLHLNFKRIPAFRSNF